MIHNNVKIDTGLSPAIRMACLASAGIALLLIVWFRYAPLSSAVIAQGSVGLEGHQSIVQHADSGVIKRLLVQEGDSVREGDTLIELDTSSLQATEIALKTQYLQLKLEKTRQHAVIKDLDHVRLDPSILKLAKDLQMPHKIEVSHSLWKEDQNDYARRLGELDLRHQQSIENHQHQTRLLSYWKEQLGLLTHDQKALYTLSEKSMISTSQRLKIDRAIIDLEKNIELCQHNIQKHRADIEDYPNQRMDISRDRQKSALLRYQELDQLETELTRKLAMLNEDYKRSKILAPISGKVSSLSVSAAGGTIRANYPLMEIVPSDRNFVIEARLSPEDIDSLSNMAEAKVRLTGLNPRHTPLLDAMVVSVSPNVIETDLYPPHYKVEVALNSGMTATHLHPGMPADVMIETVNRSLFDALIGRVIRFSETAMRETI